MGRIASARSVRIGWPASMYRDGARDEAEPQESQVADASEQVG
jgi:hypothetical protein